MGFGKYYPNPERYGGLGTQRYATIKVIADALGKSLGTAFDSSLGSTVEVENWGIARALWETFETNRRLSYVADPRRVSGPILVRWERICGLGPDPRDTEPKRRRAFTAHVQRNGFVPFAANIEALLADLLGAVFVAVNRIGVDDAVTWWPGGTPNEDAPWYSTIMYLPLQTQKPAGYTEADFLAAVAKIHPLLDAVMPSHMTWAWYRNDPAHAGDGDSLSDPDAGFYLDDGLNLNFEAFDA